MEDRADRLLCCALSFSVYEGKPVPIPLSFEGEEEAVKIFSDALWYEAKQQIGVEIPYPNEPHLHPVDLYSDHPGIILACSKQKTKKILRKQRPLPRVTYCRQEEPLPNLRVTAPPPISLEKARKDALKRDAKAEKLATNKAKRGLDADMKAIERSEKKDELKRQRESESNEERKERLRKSKEEREEKKIMKAQQMEEEMRGNEGSGETQEDEHKTDKRLKKEKKEKKEKTEKTEKKEKDPVAQTEDEEMGDSDGASSRDVNAVLTEDCDACTDHIIFPYRMSKTTSSEKLFPSPVPFDRHLLGISASKIHESLLPSVLTGRQSDYLKIIHGPPGTGKTYNLASVVKNFPDARILACAPTNVGTCNLYECILRYEDEAALLVSPSKMPPSTPVVSQDPSARIVCATISGAAGPLLAHELFDVILIDEAAQCSEAWVWSILRSTVQYLVMAGDHEQLPAQVSPEGAQCGHGRSMMERLLTLGYEAEYLQVQRRMHPAISAFPNATFYGGRLTDEYSVPESLSVVHPLPDPYLLLHVEGQCKQLGSSFYNLEEVEACLSLKQSFEKVFSTVVLITPYQAQARELMARGGGKNVHTIDSFQGKEADAVILSIVRTEEGGFWDDHRRLNVALTRAKHCMRVVGSTNLWKSNGLLSLARDANVRNLIFAD